ncbi:hypothetical protein FGO68_gene4473 [Halteria grandinella]|uniref:Uncharacterized protein n=1 Tax=Halteria grandinella TaxID=5974 RepID=A0A8J8P1F3_HALGN|nr:hypothetical protein FGO68_gene4473 [Halteria grandinella]
MYFNLNGHLKVCAFFSIAQILSSLCEVVWNLYLHVKVVVNPFLVSFTNVQMTPNPLSNAILQTVCFMCKFESQPISLKSSKLGVRNLGLALYLIGQGIIQWLSFSMWLCISSQSVKKYSPVSFSSRYLSLNGQQYLWSKQGL